MSLFVFSLKMKELAELHGSYGSFIALDLTQKDHCFVQSDHNSHFEKDVLQM